MRKILSVIAVLTAYFSCFSTVSAYSQEKQNRDTVYVIEIRQNIDNSSMRRLSLGLEDAQAPTACARPSSMRLSR